MIHTLSLTLPAWTTDIDFERRYPTHVDKMEIVLHLAQQNILHQTGGPFGAAIFAEETLIAIGVNRVVPESCSFAHAEMLAFAMAQQHYKHFDLGASSLPPHTLATSAQMCAMCFGASIWSGVTRIIYGATAHDVESLTGFDEGPIATNWREELSKRGIEVVPEVERTAACDILKHYKKSAGIIYNSRGKA